MKQFSNTYKLPQLSTQYTTKLASSRSIIRPNYNAGLESSKLQSNPISIQNNCYSSNSLDTRAYMTPKYINSNSNLTKCDFSPQSIAKTQKEQQTLFKMTAKYQLELNLNLQEMTEWIDYFYDEEQFL